MLSYLIALSFIVAGPPKLPDAFPGEVPAPEAEPEVESPDSTDPVAPEDTEGGSPPTSEVGDVRVSPAEVPVEGEGSKTSIPATCPCDLYDWMCRQSNEVLCPEEATDPDVEPVEPERPDELEASPPSRTPTMAERRRQRDSEPSADPDEVRGKMLQMGLGLGGCWQSACAPNPISIIAHGGFGYRMGRWGVGARVAGGGGPLTDTEGALRLLEVDFGFEFFPARTHTFDPYLGIGIGYLRVTEAFALDTVGDGTPGRLKAYFSRGALRVSAGWPFWVSERWSVGPRFDYTWGFAGSVCTKGADTDRDCETISSIVNDVAGTDDTVARRSVRRELFPRPWMLSLELRRQF